ncbi:MAG: DUF2252 domain-containing protein [Roseomonas sp.]|nr:DUF2252 domain-containing protein [Roseomonas sp.]MCA3291809.1 DUF2252 domain-containing protein [Roseomonas sp.]MCA3296261.1 DUF2252 domain-containing protein [Roseomonas sp.]
MLDPAHRSHAEHETVGKALRQTVSRDSHAKWKKPADRVDPITFLQASDAERLPDLVPIRWGRMLASPFAFYRGSAGLMAADLAKTPTTDLRVQACGDCHLMNFGGFATPERSIIFDMNDFDETLPAPFEWDVKRLAASFVLAARSLGFSDAKGREAAETAARNYRKRLREFAEMHPTEVWYARLTADDLIETLPKNKRKEVLDRIEKALDRSGSEMDFPKLGQVVGGQPSIRDAPPLLFHPEVTRLPAFKGVIDAMLAQYRETLSEDRRTLLDRYRPMDAAIKVVGIGSVGRRCWILLMMSTSNEPLFLQFKEAAASVLEPFAGASAYPHHGQRVVMGQRLMQPTSDIFLGWVTGANGVHFYVRQLRDAKIKPLIETFDEEMLDLFAKSCGTVLARAHAKAGGVSQISGYLGSGEDFDEAMGRFGIAYADQAERDHAALKAAVRQGKVRIMQEA